MRRALTYFTFIGLVNFYQMPISYGFDEFKVAKGIQALDSDEADAALAFFQQFLGKHSGTEKVFAEVRFLAAKSAARLQRYPVVLDYLYQLEAQLPEVGDIILAERAKAHRMVHRWDASLASWKQLLAEYPESSLAREAAFGCGDAYYAMGKLDKAIESYNQGIALKRSAGGATHLARFAIARISERKERWDDAASIYRYFYYRRPSAPLAEEAKARLDVLEEKGLVGPTPFKTHLLRVDALLTRRSLDKAEAAIKATEPTAKGQEDRKALTYRKAKLAYRRGDFEAAVTGFSGLVAGASKSKAYDYQGWIARSHSSNGATPNAIAIYRKLAERYGSTSWGRRSQFKAAWLAYHNSDHHQALRLFGEYLERYPTDSRLSEVFWYMAWNAYRLGDLPTASLHLRKLRERFPESSLVHRSHYWEGRIRATMGDLAAARKSYEQAVQEGASQYYRALAKQRLRELDSSSNPVALKGGGRLLAVADGIQTDAHDDSFEPLRDELAARPMNRRPIRWNLPWGGSLFDWSGPAGQRGLRLIRLGFYEEAAELVRNLPALPGYSTVEMAESRSLLLQTLQDFHGSYRLAYQAFRTALQREPTPETKRFFRMGYPRAYIDAVQQAADMYNVPTPLIWSVMRRESAFKTGARSWVSAQGLMQIIPTTGRKIAKAIGFEHYNDEVLGNPRTNIQFGTWYLSELLKKFQGHPVLAIASYNAGPVAVSQWIKRGFQGSCDEFIEEIPYRETRHYVKAVLGNLGMYQQLYNDSTFVLPSDVPDTFLNNISF